MRPYGKFSTIFLAAALGCSSFAMAGPAPSPVTTSAKPAPVKMGIFTNYAGVIVRNLPIGQTVSMKKLSNLPLVIQSKYPTAVYVTVEIAKPTKLFEDYEAIPDTAWVRVEAAGVTVPARGQAQLDVIVSLPNDETLMGRKFQTHLEIRTAGLPAGFLKFGAHNTDKLFFSVAATKGDHALKEALAKPRDTAFELSPYRVDLYQITAGQKVEVKADGQAVTLQNTSKKTQTYYLSAKELDGSVARPDAGSQPANPNDLTIQPEEVTLKPGESKSLEITVQVPEGIDLSKGPLFALVSVRSGLKNYAEKYFRAVLHAGDKPEPKQPEKGKAAQ